MAVSHQVHFATFLPLIVLIILPTVLSLEPSFCRHWLYDPSGTFTSPEYYGDYPNHAICTWEIKVAEGKRIRLRFTEFQLGASLPKCATGYLEIHDGVNFAAFCGTDFPPVTESKANFMKVILHADGLINLEDKFAAEYETFEDGGEEPDEDCAYHVDLTNKTTYGFLASPNHPGNYPDNAKCRYDIVWERDGELWTRFTQLGFLRFKTVAASSNSSLGSTGDLVRTYRDGIEDSTLLFGGNYQIPAADAASNLPFVSKPRIANLSLAFTSDGGDTDAGFLMAFASEIAPYSSEEAAVKMRQQMKRKEKASEKKITTTNNLALKGVVHMDFVSKKITATNPKYNGLAHFGSSNGAPAAESFDYGFIMSPNHPLEYDPYESVMYNITVPAGKKVAVCLLRMATEGVMDHLFLSDPEDQSGDAWMYYGNDESSIPHVWVSPKSNQLVAHFASDKLGQMTGFLAAVAAVDMEPASEA